MRELACRSGVSLRAAQVALQSLRRIGLVQHQRSGQRVVYSLNQRHPEFPIAVQLVDIQVKEDLRLQSERDSKTNRGAIKLASQMYAFAEKLRRHESRIAVS